MYNKIIILLLEIGFGINFNIVGTISLSELVLIGTSFWYVKKDLFIKYPVLKTITWLYIGLLLSQILSENVTGNIFSNSLKGYAVTIVSYLHFIFLFSFFIKDRKYILYAIIGMLASNFLFGSQFEGDVSEVVSGEGAVFLKFYLAPMIINILLLISIFTKRLRISLLCIFVGGCFIVLGARSSGLSILLTGLLAYFIVFFKIKINQKKLLMITLFVSLVGYGLYVVYVNEVINGKITAGNSLQLKEAKNPYNPVNLLIMGRTETFVGWVAFIDQPWFGHGAWAKDTTGKYRALIFKFRDSESKISDLGIIPSHSIIIGAGMQNGLLAFIFMGSILIFFIKKGFKSINRVDPYIIIIISFIISIIWNGLFSPISHFRLTLPLAFAILLSTYILNKRNKMGYKRLENKRRMKLYEKIINTGSK